MFEQTHRYALMQNRQILLADFLVRNLIPQKSKLQKNSGKIKQ